MVRVGNSDSTRPAREMQSGTRCRIALACSCNTATQHEHQRPPSSCRQERHAPGVDGKLPRELLGGSSVTIDTFDWMIVSDHGRIYWRAGVATIINSTILCLVKVGVVDLVRTVYRNDPLTFNL